MSLPVSTDSQHPATSLQGDLRHMTSNIGTPPKDPRASHRVSQHLRMSPARSPTSIPSSPTSVHSSSSAIFERDIEPISPPSPQPHQYPSNPHRIPRSKATEQLEHSVPSVLDSAAAILAGLEDSDPAASDQIAVVAPASLDHMSRSSGFASPIGSFRSRSPSPTIGSRHGVHAQGIAGHNRNSLLLSIPPSVAHVALPTQPPLTSTLAQHQSQGGTAALPPIAIPRPTIHTNINIDNSISPNATHSAAPTTPPSIITPTSAYFTTASNQSSPTTTTREHPQTPLPPASSASPSPPSTISTSWPLTSPTSPSTHPQTSPTAYPPPSPTHGPAAAKRLSFMSYADLLSSTPASTLPLSSLTTAASSVEPPPHIPSVSGFGFGGHAHAQQQVGSAAASLRGFVVGALPTSTGKRDSVAMLDDVGGEWEREGLGRGLEERLDALMHA